MGAQTAIKKQEFKEVLQQISSVGLGREKNISRALSKIDGLLRTPEGIVFLYNNIKKVSEAGIFAHTSWDNPQHLVPTLVEGTLSAGFPSVIYESLSELRMLRIALGEWKSDQISAEKARLFLQDAVINSFKLAFGESREDSRDKLTPNSRQRIALLFSFILEKMPLDTFKDKLAREVKEFSDQRAIMTGRLEETLYLVHTKIELNEKDESDRLLASFTSALYEPTTVAGQYKEVEDYADMLEELDHDRMMSEANQMASSMHQTGLVSPYHAVLTRRLARRFPDSLPLAFGLSSHGIAEFERHRDFVIHLVTQYISKGNKEVVYGLARLLNRTLLSRKAVYHALTKLLSTRLHPEVRRRLTAATARPAGVDAQQWLGGGIIRMLGLPLGVGQGLNPTCQSARGLSMWSRHSPGKLLNMLAAVVASNELKFRFEGELITSTGLVNEKTFDYNLDPVSVILVPHLDHIYQQMMQKAQMKYPHKDPHVTVNPAFYGLWIQTGFISCYNPTLNVIQNYRHFIRLFYAAFHPKYNGGFRLAYPVPLGIFITTAQAEFLGFHAVSLLRVDQSPSGEWRAYFFNPNNEGRQDWGQHIKPTVSGNGEHHGESSLPFFQFASRVYAFHYNSFDAESSLDKVKAAKIDIVEELARDSWGKNYFWD